MDYSLSDHINNQLDSECDVNVDKCEFDKELTIIDYLPCKVQKLNDQINSFTNIQCHSNLLNNANDQNVIIPNKILKGIPPQNYVRNNNIASLPFIPFQPIPSNQRLQNKTFKHKVGYWGPLLRYGTYGIYKIYSDNVILKKRKSTENGKLKETLKCPIELPFHIKMPRQAMICTIQSYLKYKLNDLRKLENDELLHMGINYSTTLEQLTNQCGTCPKYLFTKVANIPEIEREFFTTFNRNETIKTYLSYDGSRLIEIKPITEYVACELLISDIIISQGFALWKRRARETCARKAFKVLDRPCFMVGSTRYWCNSDYLTACITEDLQMVTVLPPFLTDPTEPLFKKDEKINKSDPEENFDIMNPKTIDDFWLYAPTLTVKGKIKDLDPQILLYQSAEFSQMNISFEIETCFDESYTCIVLLDKSAVVTVEGLGSLEQARQAASLVLVDKLIDTQPIVVLQESCHDQYNSILNDHMFRNNDFLVRSLMWSPTYTCIPLAFENLSDVIDIESFDKTEDYRNISSKDIVRDTASLSYFLNLYAQSSVVDSVKLQRDINIIGDLWHLVPETARLSGLVVSHGTGDSDSIESVLLCKQVPHRQLKAMLFSQKQFGVFRLLCDGCLGDGYLNELRGYVSSGIIDSCVDRTQSRDYSVDSTESRDYRSSSTDIADTSSLFRDIINDIAQDLIPGFDY